MNHDGIRDSDSGQSKDGEKWTEGLPSDESSEKLGRDKTEDVTVVPQDDLASTSPEAGAQSNEYTYPEGGARA